MKKDPLVFLYHILDCIKNIQTDVNKLTKEKFLQARTEVNAVLWNIEVIGEAAKNIPNTFRGKHLEVPWKQIAGMRDKFIHEYFGIDIGNVWKVVTEDIPVLKKKVNQMLKEELK
ncbi:DUF86 domain-containing protein [Candidatus Woesearchaeota archaeon]|nr:DUF86 domain-containing protein [Candidatus Woesearchaeota archaeon]